MAGQCFLDILFCLAVAHHAPIVAAVSSGTIWTQAVLQMLWVATTQLHQLVGLAPLVWLLPFAAVMIVKNWPDPEPDFEPRWLRRRKMPSIGTVGHATARRRSLPASWTMDSTSATHVTFEMKASSTNVPPTLNEQGLLSALRMTGFVMLTNCRSGHKRSAQFHPGPDYRRKGDGIQGSKGSKKWHSKSSHRSSGPHPVRPIPMPPRVHRTKHHYTMKGPQSRMMDTCCSPCMTHNYNDFIPSHRNPPPFNPFWGKCHTCGVQGHRTRECPSKSKSHQHTVVAPNWSDLPTQSELDNAREHQYDRAVAFHVAMEDSFVQAALMAPHKVKEATEPDSSFHLIWDSGASKCISNNNKDFVGPIRSAGFLKQLTGLATGL